jgi:outer membrane receptor protein involved in Fe transport
MKNILVTLLIFLCSFSFAQQGKGILTGVVKDLKTGLPIKDVTVRISQLKISTTTNENGEFKFENLAPGPYTLRLFHKRYNTLKIPHQEVFANSAISLPINMVPGGGEGEGQDDAFFIGGMEVVAKKNVLPDKILTTTEISSGQIEHLQATNLSDVMQLIPGVPQQTKLGLSKSANLTLSGVSAFDFGVDRTAEGSAFGTKIIYDGSTLSNNASVGTISLNGTVQTGTMESGATTGIDLRGIPADNVESIEVLRGVASAKYGDFTEGVILVKTKSGYQPQRAKIKINPNTDEFNFNGGANLLEGMGVNYNFNLASTTRDIRREGDSYERLSGQLKFANTFLEDKSLTLSNGFYYTRLFDEYKNVADPEGQQSYNHTYTLRYNNELIYKIDNYSKFEFHSTVSMTNQDKFKQDALKGTNLDNRYITNFMTAGTYRVIRNYGTYNYQATEKGKIWTITADAEWSKRAMKTGSFIHNFAAGMNYQYDANTGEGYKFDMSKPPQKDKRPFPYDSMPTNNLLSAYAEDEIHGVLWKPFTLSVGLRYDMFSPQKIDWKGLGFTTDFIKSRSGSFLQPRLSFRYFLSPETRLRLAYGKTSKAPALDLIYPQPQYADIRDYYGDARDNSDTLLYSTYVFNQRFENARGYTENKYELSVDQKITDEIGLTLRGYYSYRDNELILYSKYVLIPVMSRPNYPSNEGSKILSYTPIELKEYHNAKYSTFNGVDLILTTKRIEALSSSFSITGNYEHSEYGKTGGVMDYTAAVKYSTLDSLKKLYHSGDYIIPVYCPGKQQKAWYQKIMFTYRWDFTVRKLGIWVTLAAQQIYSVKYKTFDAYNDYAVGYYTDKDGGKYVPYSSDVPKEAKFRSYENFYMGNGIVDTWAFNLNVSKSLYKGAEISFFVNNFVDRYNRIFYGLEFSMDAGKIFE